MLIQSFPLRFLSPHCLSSASYSTIVPLVSLAFLCEAIPKLIKAVPQRISELQIVAIARLFSSIQSLCSTELFLCDAIQQFAFAAQSLSIPLPNRSTPSRFISELIHRTDQLFLRFTFKAMQSHYRTDQSHTMTKQILAVHSHCIAKLSQSLTPQSRCFALPLKTFPLLGVSTPPHCFSEQIHC